MNTNTLTIIAIISCMGFMSSCTAILSYNKAKTNTAAINAGLQQKVVQTQGTRDTDIIWVAKDSK